MKTLRYLTLGLLAIAVVGCSTDKADKPAPLAKHLVNGFPIDRVWHEKLSGEAWKLRLGLRVAADGNKLFAATYKGSVDAINLDNGKRLWTHRVKVPLAGGPSVGNGLVVIGSAKGDVIVLSETDGAQRWRVRVNAELLSSPAIDGNLVVVRGVDGKMHGLSSTDGSELWVVDQQVPKLSLRGTGNPLIDGDVVICGFDNGRVMAVTRTNGTTAWDTPVGQPHGSTELQRLVDVDAPIVADGDDVFAVSYQGRAVRMARDTGEVIWSRDVSSYRGLAVSDDAVYVTDADGSVVRLDRKTGAEMWRQKGLARRQLTAPSVYGGRVVVADLQGYVHWLDADSGKIVARMRVGKRRASAAPVVAGGLLVVFTDGGELAAFRAPAQVAAAK